MIGLRGWFIASAVIKRSEYILKKGLGVGRNSKFAGTTKVSS